MRALLISGSTRAGSANTAALMTAAALAPSEVQAVLYQGLAALPAFNPDHDGDLLPEPVAELRREIGQADAVLLCTPEYAGTLPGSLKNLLDWTVGGGELYGKPVAWVNVAAAANRGQGAQETLALVLGYVGAAVIDPACRHIPVDRSAIGPDGMITDPGFRAGIAGVWTALVRGAGADELCERARLGLALRRAVRLRSAQYWPGDLGGGPRVSSWVVPGYAEERELGSGASGRVAAAVQVATGARVAVKYLSPRLLSDPGFLASFRGEAQLLRSLTDPHVVRLFDYVEEPGTGAAIVMELVRGVSLHEMITGQGPTGAESALLVLKGSLLGLAAAHAAGIVHRDYKPENVLVDEAGTSKLTDFGVAVRAGQGGPAAGTPFYMAPEQWDGTPATPAADIYAATAVFFECLTGMTPFSGGLAQLAAQHAAAAVPVAMVDEPLRPLIARGMAKDPTARPATATALVSELEATAAAAYGPGWEDRGRAQLAGRAAALLLLLAHGQAAAASGTGTATTATTLAPKAGVVATHAGLNGWQITAAAIAVSAAVAGTVVGVGALASTKHPAPAPTAVAASATPSARPTSSAPIPSLLGLDVTGGPLDPRIVPVARATLTAAFNHDAAAIDKLLGPTASASAVNKILAQPGAYQQIITLLTKTHGVSQDGYTAWPSFLLAGLTDQLAAADAKVLGVTSAAGFKGRITVGIGDSYLAKPYVPRLDITVYGP